MNGSSPSSQRAWIEIIRASGKQWADLVALLAEGVDRNHSIVLGSYQQWVALLAEGVDRNSATSSISLMAASSPSSQRAWIEILRP